MATAKDPICGKEVDTLRARAVGIFGGVTYYFCSAECKSKFKDPRKAPREAAPLEPETVNLKKKKERKDPSLDELPPMKVEAAGDEGLLPDLTPDQPIAAPSPSVEMELSGMKAGSRRWAVVIALVAILVVVAAVLSLR